MKERKNKGRGGTEIKGTQRHREHAVCEKGGDLYMESAAEAGVVQAVLRAGPPPG